MKASGNGRLACNSARLINIIQRSVPQWRSIAELTCLVWAVKQLGGCVKEVDIYYIRTKRMIIAQLYSIIFLLSFILTTACTRSISSLFVCPPRGGDTPRPGPGRGISWLRSGGGGAEIGGGYHWSRSRGVLDRTRG